MANDTILETVQTIDARLERVEQFLPTLATKAELAEAIEPLATKEELAEAIRPLATRAELKEALAEQRDELRRHFDTVAERIEERVRLIAEGHTAQVKRLDVAEGKNAAEHNAFDQRITALEISSRPPRPR